ncbi:MAG: TonB-dependent receptor [Gammaproteobacteria bacterium]|nr:TonB-dependent receptor [Gammaproteobacteria bacterium]MBT8111729.1 TonB-dependent receptor [Gammaproteobacteria bacterium]NNL46428.1 TonB-dependent receptor [Woeseiaceae bacterium]
MKYKARFIGSTLTTLQQAAVILFAAAMLLAVPVAGNAQETTSAIRGTVTDEGGNVISGASVTITHVPTGRSRTVQTTAGGRYSASGLRVGGPYLVAFDSPSHQGANFDNVYLALADTLRLDAQLGGGAIEEVIVFGSAIEASATAGSSSIFNQEFIEDTATFNRDLKDIIKRNPFAVVLPGGEAPLSIAGVNPAYNSLTVDGVGQNDDFGLNDNGYPSQRSPISLEALEQLTVDVSPFSPRYGGFSGGQVNVVTKSGTNQFHGSVFYEDIDDSRSGTPKLPDGTPVDLTFKEEAYGGFISGPIIKDKLFFVASYEWFETPTNIEWGPTGSGAPNEANVTEADFLSVVDIADRIYGVDAGTWNTSIPEEDEKILFKLDWNINDDHRAALTYQRTEGNSASNLTSSPFELRLSSHWYNRGELLESYAGHLFSQWGDRFSTEIKIVDKTVDNLQAASDLSFGDVLVDTPSGDVALGPDQFRHANQLDTSTLQFVAHGNYDMGNHAIGFGIDHTSIEIFNLFAPQSLGVWEFDSLADFENRIASDFTYNNAFSNVAADAGATFELATTALYVEDTVQIGDSLEIAFGLRYERISNDDRPANNANFAARYGFANTENLDGADNILPRVGFNWDVTDRLRLHGGVGKYGGGRPNVWISNSYANDGITFTTFDDDPLVVDPATYLTNVDITSIPTEVTSNMVAGDGNTNSIQPGFEIPTEWRFKLGAEYLFDFPGLGEDWTVNLDFLHMDSSEGLHWTELARQPSGRRTADGGRIIYEPIDQLTGGPTDRYDIMLGNAPGGDSTIISASLAKDWDNGFSLYTAYANQDTSEGNPGTSSTATSNYQFNAAFDKQFPTFGPAAYEIEHRFTIDLRYARAFFGDYETRFNLFFERRSGVPFSWALGAFRDGDLGDQSALDDSDYYLPYIPSGPSDPNVVYSGTDYDEFSEQIMLAGLSGFAGGYVPKGSSRTPWVTQIDLRIDQEFPGFSEDHRAVVFFEVLNLYNLIDSDKGKVLHNQFRSSSRILADYDIDPVTNQYIYQEPFGGWQTDANWDEFVAEESQWRLKLGVRYRF